MKKKVEDLRRGNGWLVCGNYPVMSNTIYLPESFAINPATQKRLAELIYEDLQWRQDILFCQSVGGADEDELEILKQQQPGLRFWHVTRVDYATAVHYLHWSSGDRGAWLLDAQYNSYFDLMDGLEKTEPDFVFSLGAGGEDKMTTIHSFIREVYQKLQAGNRQEEKSAL